MNARFEFYEVVRVSSQRPEVQEIDTFEGAVLGRARNDKGEWSYAVYVLTLDETWNLNEAELTSTGRFMKREDFKDGESIRIAVDPETGEGKPGED